MLSSGVARTRFVDAVLLRSVDYGDADRIVTLLTPEHGKVSVLARAARKSQKRFGGALEACCVLRVEIGDGRGELGRLAQAQLVRAFPGILRDLSKLAVAGAALELVREATAPREPDARVFETVVAMLDAVDRAGGGAEQVLACFQVRLMAVLGLAPGLDACAECGRRAHEGQAALFDPQRGSVVCRACGGGSFKLGGRARARMMAALGPSWAAAAVEPWPADELGEARDALDAFLARHLDKHLEGAAIVAQVGALSGPRGGEER